MGGNVSLRGNDSSTQKQNEDQNIAALLLVISKNVLSMERLVEQFDLFENIEEFKNQLNENQNLILKLIKEATTDIGKLAHLDYSELRSSERQLQKRRQRERYQNELTATLDKFHSVLKLAVEKEENKTRKKGQEMKNELENELESVRVLILIITRKVHQMKRIVNQLTITSENTEELLNELYQIDHYTGLLIDDASDCIEKQAESLVPAKSSDPNQDSHQGLKLEDTVSIVHNVDSLLSTIQMLDTEKESFMAKVDEFKKLFLRRKNEKSI